MAEAQPVFRLLRVSDRWYHENTICKKLESRLDRQAGVDFHSILKALFKDGISAAP